MITLYSARNHGNKLSNSWLTNPNLQGIRLCGNTVYVTAQVTLPQMYINLQTPCVLCITTGVSLSDICLNVHH